MYRLGLILAHAALCLAAPTTYDQRQDGEMNVRADVQNVVLIIAVPQKKTLASSSLLDLFTKSDKRVGQEHGGFQERADLRVLEAFVEPPTPYHVEIIGDLRSNSGSNLEPIENQDYLTEDRDAKVVEIAAKRKDNAIDDNSYKLIGALEQCGPERVRDSEGICRDASNSNKVANVKINENETDKEIENESSPNETIEIPKEQEKEDKEKKETNLNKETAKQSSNPVVKVSDSKVHTEEVNSVPIITKI